MEYELTPDAIELGLSDALPAVFGYLRGSLSRRATPRQWDVLADQSTVWRAPSPKMIMAVAAARPACRGS